MNTYCGFSSLTEQCLPKDSMYANTSNNCLKNTIKNILSFKNTKQLTFTNTLYPVVLNIVLA